MLFRKYKYVPQIDRRDCGVAALSMVIKSFGSNYSLAKLRELTKTEKEGTSALGIVKAAQKLNFETQAIRGDMELFNLKEVNYPFIAHIIQNNRNLHYVVVYKAKKKYLIVANPDPKVKIKRILKKEFEKEWTGVAIFITPTPSYTPVKDKKNGLMSFIPVIIKNKKLIINIIISALIITLISIAGSYYLQGMIDNYIPNHMLGTLTIVSIGLVISYIIQQLLTFSQKYLLTILGQRLAIDVILSYVRHIYQLPMTFFNTRRTGEIVSRFTDANAIIDALASMIMSLFLDVTVLVIVGAILLIQNYYLFLLTLAILPVYLFIISIFIKPFEKLNSEVMEANAVLRSSIIEDINGIETIKSMTSEKARYKNIDKEFVTYLKKSLKYSRLEAIQGSLKSGTQLILSVTILCLGADLVLKNDISLGQLITYNTLLVYFTNPLENIINLQTKIQAARVANKRLNEVFLVESEFLEDKKQSEILVTKNDIKIENVSYNYGYGRKTISNVSLNILEKQKVSIIGASGSGKTTLAKLLVNFFEISEGTIKVGNISIKDINKKILRKKIHYLPQEPYIFSGTILDNLILGSKEEVAFKKIREVAEFVGIRSEIEAMPLNYQTALSSEGMEISVGQKQRISLARALLTEAPILILDEITSGLDIINERKIINNLLSLDNKTIIFIVHRLEIAKKCHKIFLIDQGKLIEQGNHKELMDSKGAYYQLVEK